jgi:hypothetical protein
VSIGVFATQFLSRNEVLLMFLASLLAVKFATYNSVTVLKKMFEVIICGCVIIVVFKIM